MLEQRRERRLAGEQHVGLRFAGRLAVGDRQPGHGQASQQGEQHEAPLHVRAQEQGRPPDPVADQCGRRPDGQRPAELRQVQMRRRREVRDGQGERPVPGPRVQAEEDQRPHARAQQAGDQHDGGQRAAQHGGLQQQERGGQRIPEQGADGREAPGCGEYRAGAGGHIAPGQLDRQERQPAAERDQRALGPDHRAQAQAHQRRQEDAGQLVRLRHAACFEAVSG
jgi:hypothetical protein